VHHIGILAFSGVESRPMVGTSSKEKVDLSWELWIKNPVAIQPRSKHGTFRLFHLNKGHPMPRIDDYYQALDLGIKTLLEMDPEYIAGLSGADFHSDGSEKQYLSLVFLNNTVDIGWPDMSFTLHDSKDEIPIQQKILILHYLNGMKNGTRLSGEWIGFQEIPDGRFYLDAFIKRAKIPLVQGFGDQPERLGEMASTAYQARPFDYGDQSVLIQAFPHVPLALILWKGDEEFPPDGNILFDKSIATILSAEDVAWLSGMVVYPLIGMLKAKG
jgi:hypothetical protein